jgi:hypothetical protein
LLRQAATLPQERPPGPAKGFSGLSDAAICGRIRRIWFLKASPAATPTNSPLTSVLTQKSFLESWKYHRLPGISASSHRAPVQCPAPRRAWTMGRHHIGWSVCCQTMTTPKPTEMPSAACWTTR